MSRSLSEDENVRLLLVLIKRGDKEAQEELFALYSRKFYNFAHLSRGLSREDAEDAVQITFGRIFEKINIYQVETQSGLGWIWRIFQNVVTDVFRSNARDERKQYKLSNSINEEDLARSLYEKKIRLQIFYRAWNNISNEDRLTIESRHENPASANRTGKRGPAGRKYQEAAKRFRAEYQKCLKEIE